MIRITDGVWANPGQVTHLRRIGPERTMVYYTDGTHSEVWLPIDEVAQIINEAE